MRRVRERLGPGPARGSIVEAFEDGAGEAHVTSEHFKAAMGWMPDVVATTPSIVSATIPGALGWSEMAEVTPRGQRPFSEKCIQSFDER